MPVMGFFESQLLFLTKGQLFADDHQDFNSSVVEGSELLNLQSRCNPVYTLFCLQPGTITFGIGSPSKQMGLLLASCCLRQFLRLLLAAGRASGLMHTKRTEVAGETAKHTQSPNLP
ncbi:unnamed protein product [Protopolystoma xenopodis]|uniref:Uncharacterized protein n=1 Tax=Protopolystoma xenopodis TaxID=117903 RepID=A0A3S5B2E9_9PLAT|nr:unnamed protein product [Protopolystoma xenopodis]